MATNLFRDKTDIDNLDSITKAKLATIFPVIRFPQKFESSQTEKYFLETDTPL
mgnify:CR=1 FL=1